MRLGGARSARSDGVVPALEARPRQRRLHRVDRDAVVEQPVAQVRRAEAVAAPGAAGRAAERHAAVADEPIARAPHRRSDACAGVAALGAVEQRAAALRRSRGVRRATSAVAVGIEAARGIVAQQQRQLRLGGVGEPHHRDGDALARRRRAPRRRRRRSERNSMPRSSSARRSGARAASPRRSRRACPRSRAAAGSARARSRRAARRACG